MKDNRMINAEKRPIPTSPSEKQITVEGQKSMKGSADFTSKLPEKHLIPDGVKGKGFSSR